MAVKYEKVECAVCSGDGVVQDEYDDLMGYAGTYEKECPECEGKGYVLVTEKTCACGQTFKGTKEQKECYDCRLKREMEEIKIFMDSEEDTPC